MIDVYWLEQSERDVPEGDGWLSESDASRLMAMRIPKRRADSRLGRWTAKCAASLYLQAHVLAEIEIRPSALGAPEVFVADKPAHASISLSHRSGVALCAIAPFGTALGCDLETIEPRSAAFASDYFTSEERKLIANSSCAERPRLLALLWSAKESALKALQEGLRLDTRSVEVSLDLNSAHDRNQWFPLEVQYERSRCFRGWWQDTGKMVRTLVADPAPAIPIPLHTVVSLVNEASGLCNVRCSNQSSP